MNDLAKLLTESMWRHRQSVVGETNDKAKFYMMFDRLHLIEAETQDITVREEIVKFNQYIKYRSIGYSDIEACLITHGRTLK